MESPNINQFTSTVTMGESNFAIESSEGSAAIAAGVKGLSINYTLSDTPIGTISLMASGLSASVALGFSDKGSFIPGLNKTGIEFGASASYGEANLHFENSSRNFYGGIGLANGIGFNFKNINGEIGFDIKTSGIHVYAGKK
jgi:hypothetical protein